MTTSINKNEPISNGRRKNLAELFSAHRLEIWKSLRARLRNDQEADDLVQQTYLRYLLSKGKSDISNPRAYLRVTANNVLVDFYRREQTHHSKSHVEFDENQHLDSSELPENLILSDEKLGHIAVVLRILSEPVRRAFILSRVYGYTYVEIGTILSLSHRTIEKHVAKGLRICRAGLEEQEQRNVTTKKIGN